MFLFTALLHLLLSNRNHKSSNHPIYTHHNDFSPIYHSLSSTSESKDFNENDDNHTDNHTSFAILLRKYSKIAPNLTSDDSPPTFSNKTEVNISTIQKFYRYYELLQVLQSPYVSQQQKIETIQQNTEIFSTSSITPKLWSGLDW
jgi:hypothetical protein